MKRYDDQKIIEWLMMKIITRNDWFRLKMVKFDGDKDKICFEWTCEWWVEGYGSMTIIIKLTINEWCRLIQLELTIFSISTSEWHLSTCCPNTNLKTQDLSLIWLFQTKQIEPYKYMWPALRFRGSPNHTTKLKTKLFSLRVIQNSGAMTL